MIEFKGEFATTSSDHRKAFEILAPLAGMEGIIEDQLTTLVLTTHVDGRTAETRAYVGKHDVDTPIAVWIKEGVQKLPARIELDLITPLESYLGKGRSPLPSALEILAHEWGIHGEKEWTFICAMRTANTLKEVEKAFHTDRDLQGTTAETLLVHRDLAEGTHVRHRALMQALRKAQPKLEKDLLDAWQQDIDTYAVSARTGRLSLANWDGPVLHPKQEPAKKPPDASKDVDDFKVEGGEADLEDFLEDT